MFDDTDRAAGLRALADFRPASFDLSGYSNELRTIVADLPIIGGKESVWKCIDYFVVPGERRASTIKSYLRCLRTQERYDRDFVSYANPRSYQVHRAALIYQSNARLYQALHRAARYLRGEWTPASEVEIARIGSDIEGQIHELQSIAGATRCTNVGQKKRDKDSLLLAQLPSGWCNQLLAEVAGDPNFGPAVAVLALVGARPSEFGGLGIFVTRDHEGNLLLRVNGKKVRDRAGQPWRVAKIPDSINPSAQYLREIVQASGRRGVYVKLRCIDLLSRRVTQIGRRLWPDLMQNVTASTFRQMIGSETKAAGWPRHKIAALLGHINTKTQKWYGSVRFGTGSDFWVSEVIAPIVVKMNATELKAAAELAATVAKNRNARR